MLTARRPRGRPAVGAAPTPPTPPTTATRLILFTSGTTGLPKAVGITSRQLDRADQGNGAHHSGRMPHPRSSMMSVPFFHVGGALGVLGSLYSGNT